MIKIPIGVYKRTEKHRKIIRESVKKGMKNPKVREKIRLSKLGEKNPAKRDDVKKKISNTIKEQHRNHFYDKAKEKTKLKMRTVESRKNMSELKKQQYINNPNLRLILAEKTKEIFKDKEVRRKHDEGTRKVKRICYKNIYFRSTWEVQVAKKLDGNNIEWKYEFKRFHFGSISYLPDFFLPEYNMYIEIKGWMERNKKDKERINLFKVNNKLLLIEAKQYNYVLLEEINIVKLIKNIM